MKSIFRLFAAFAAVVFALIAVIKFVQGCSWKEAVGIAEEFCKEIHDNCCPCCKGMHNNEEVSEEA